jgi:tRNA-dihydrouridine synthase
LKLWLAPLHGITNYSFRNCFVKHFHGIDYALIPFIAAQSKERLNPKKLTDLLPENNAELCVIPQIMGNKPQDIIDTIVVLNDTFGYEYFNWNIGCPMKQIVRKRRGCGVMPFADLVEEVVNEVCGKTSAHFSLKMRLGLHDFNEGLCLLQILDLYPIDFLCIHPRLGTQLYNGNVDLDTFEILYQHTNHKIVYSGDINDVFYFDSLQKRFPKIKHWMLGRGILQNPFLAEQIVHFVESRKQKVELPSVLTDGTKRFINFYNEYSEILVTLKNEKIALSSLKELWHYFAVYLKYDFIELRKLLQINDYQIFYSYVKKILGAAQ